MLLVLELVDVGYVDPESLIVRKRFGDISSVHYTGAFPLTADGVRFYRGEGMAGRLRALMEYFFRK